MYTITKIVDLTTITNANAGDLGQGVVRLNLIVKRLKAMGITRNTLVRIRNTATGNTIFALARSNNNLTGDTIALEYDQKRDLGFDPHNEGTYEISKAGKLAYFEYFRKHPDPRTRLTFNLGLLTNLLFALFGAGVGYLISLL